MKSTPKSDFALTRRSGKLLLEEPDQRLSLGNDEDGFVSRWLYLV